MDDRPYPGSLTPAEQRLVSLLVLLHGAEVRSDPTLVRRVMETARWQRAVREVLVAAGSLAAAVGDGLIAIAGWWRDAAGRLP